MKRKSFLVMVSIAGLSLSAMFTGCSSDSDAEDMTNVVYNEDGQAGVLPEFVISLPRNVVGGTRMEANIVQNTGQAAQFRGIDNIRLIPFDVDPNKLSTKLADIIHLSSISALEKPGEVNYKVYADQFVPVGTRNFLFYGKAVDRYVDEPLTSMNDKFKYGVLKSYGLAENEFTNAGSVNFRLEQINTSTEQQQNNAVGRAIIQLMSQLANVNVSGDAPENAWSTTKHKVLAALYKNFIGTTVYSSNALALILDKIYFGLEHVGNNDPAYNLANRIRSMIQDACVSGYEPLANTPVNLKSDYTGYPANIGLPDGAARCRWNASGLQANMFVDMTANYNLGFKKVKPTDYCYPAALWYYVSTPVRTSNSIESVNYDAKDSWEDVITDIYNGTNVEVVNGTRSVALVNPVQYAVGRLETSIQMESSDKIYDGDGQEVDYGDGYTLKGLLLGGQNSVNYAFESTGNENFCIYDRVMSASNLTFKPGGVATAPNHTLALETQTNQIVSAALELVNNGQAFKGSDGTIPAGGIFYMTVSLDPKKGFGYHKDNLNKIIMKDHVTKLTVTIKKGSTFPDRGINGEPPNGIPDVYVMENGVPIGVDADDDGVADPYDIDGDGTDDIIIPDPAHGGPGWDIDGDGEVDIPILPNPLTGEYPTGPTVPDGLGNATNGIPDLSSPGIELGTSVDLKWEKGLVFEPSI